MFFMFNSLDDRIEIAFHPKFHIIINNVSKHGDDYDIEIIEKDPTNTTPDAAAILSVENRINDIKAQLVEGADDFYNSDEVSENTKIGEKVWKDIKEQISQGDSFKEESWYKELKDHDKTLLKDML